MRPVLFSILVLGAALGVTATAQAPQPNGESTFSIQPGRYNWKQRTEIVGFGSNEENIECLIPEKATYTLNALAKDLDEGCHVENVSRTANGYNFKLVCTGRIPGTAQAVLSHTANSMTIQATGSATVVGFIPAGFSMHADARRVGDCSAQEITRERERWQREHPAR